MPYSAHDTPALVARIGADLAVVTATVRQGDRHLRSLVLTGGFARGEGTVLDGVPQNDYDFIAIRGMGRPARTYASMRTELEQKLGIHIDLAPVPGWRLRLAPRSVFWYETALRGQVLWGEDLLDRIPVRRAPDLHAAEGLRLLVNRAAGLLLATPSLAPGSSATADPATASTEANAVRIQAAKALLAALDAHLLAIGRFAPSQAERWALFQRLKDSGSAPPELLRQEASFEWAYRFKLDPASAPAQDPLEAWRAARRAILGAVPAALRRAGLASLSAYGRQDRLADQVVYGLRVHRVEGARRFLRNPTGRVRVATLRLLEAAEDGRFDRSDAERCFAGIARIGASPLRSLEGLRAATLQ
jgi:hypothetical protein